MKGKKIIAGFSGLRSSVEGKDFIIGPLDDKEGLINVVGIDSPGLSSSPAIAAYVEDMISGDYFKLEPDISKIRDYKIKPLFRDLDIDTKKAWIDIDPRFGKIVCRCENVTEGDIISAIHAPIPADTVDALKFKTWAGAGRCQGAFDLPRIISILSEELKIESSRVLKRGKGSNVVIGYTRDFGKK